MAAITDTAGSFFCSESCTRFLPYRYEYLAMTVFIVTFRDTMEIALLDRY